MRTCAGLLAAVIAMGQPAPPQAAAEWRKTHEREIVDEFAALLSLPNVARNRQDIRRNAEFIASMYSRRNVRTRLLELDGAPPAVYGELATPGARRTVIFYAHYDGQPVQPEKWTTGDPFRPALFNAPVETSGKQIGFPAAGQAFDPEWRLYARSSGDDKAPIQALASALDAIQAAGVKLKSNIKFLFEGEEEAGSAHLADYLRRNRELLGADVWIICDGPVNQTRRQEVVFGARGTVGMNVTVYGPRRELHSGHYGNWAPNPAMMLAQLLASMKDADGRVLVEGFYDGIVPLNEAERQAVEEAPQVDRLMLDELWLNRSERAAGRLEESINMPALNIRGLESAAVGEQSRNVIPSTATASLEIRLVKGMDHSAAVSRVVEHIRKHGFFVTEQEPDRNTRMSHARVARISASDGYNAARVPLDSPVARRVIAAIESARGKVIRKPTMGGSLPLYVFEEILNTPAIIVPIANHDNNQHGHNENIRIRNLGDGIETMAALLAMDLD